MELVDLENSPYLEVDNSVVLVREMVVDNLVVVVFFLVLEAELELEVSLMMMKYSASFIFLCLLLFLRHWLRRSWPLWWRRWTFRLIGFSLHRCIGGLLLSSKLWRRQLWSWHIQVVVSFSFGLPQQLLEDQEDLSLVSAFPWVESSSFVELLH